MSVTRFADRLGKSLCFSQPKQGRKGADKKTVYVGDTRYSRVVKVAYEHVGSIRLNNKTIQVEEVYLRDSESFAWVDAGWLQANNNSNVMRLR